MTARRAAAHLPSRSVHLRIVPRPANLSESREIYRVMQRFGELNTFKHLRHEYHNPADNIALAIYRTPEAAQQALNASPLRFALEREVPSTEPTYTDTHAPDTTHDIPPITRPSTLLANPLTPPTTTTPPSTTPPFSPRPAPATTTKWFQVSIDRSRAIHQDFIERQPLWKQFSPMKSMAQEDLAKIVPHPGLSDVSRRPPNAHRTPNKVLKSMGRWVETGMPSLKALEGDKGS